MKAKRSLARLLAFAAGGVVSVGLLAGIPAVAGATEVNPAGGVVNADNQGLAPTWFVPNNAFGTGPAPGFNQAGLGCSNTTADIPIPTDVLDRPNLGPWQNNENNPGVGDHSQGSGSVVTDIEPKPEFNNCEVYLFDLTQPGPTPTGIDAFVETFDGWSVAADVVDPDEPSVAISVPQNGAEVEIPALGCEIDIAPDRTTVAMAKYDDAAEILTVDAQVPIRGNPACEAAGITNEAPAQFEGQLNTPGLSITP